MEVEPQLLRAKRKILKSKITRIESFVKHFNAEVDHEHLINRLETLETAYKEYEDVQTSIELLDDTDNDREVQENRYYDIKASIQKILKTKHSSTGTGAATSTNTQDRIIINNEQSLRLPTLNLPSFGGRFSDWLPFRDTFDSLIHKNETLNSCQKFHYLKSSLFGEALATIESLTISVENYASAYELLNKRYNNKRAIAQEHVMTIINSPVIAKQSHYALRKLYLDLSTNIEALKVQQIPVEYWDALIVPIMTEKLDFSSRREWQTKLTAEIPTLKTFITFLEARCELLESLQQSNKPTQSSDNKINPRFIPHNSNRDKKMINTCTKSNAKCIYCDSSAHMIFSCPQFLNHTTESKIAILRKINACLNCLRTNHSTIDCKSPKRCRICNMRHNTLIHLDEQSTSNNLTLSLAHNNNKTVLLATAMVILYSPSGEKHECRALLDCGSQCNLITKKLCEKLGLTVAPNNLEITGVGGKHSVMQGITRARIHSQNNPQSFDLQCLITQKITGEYPNRTFDTSKLNIPSNIKLADPFFNESREIELLIGAENFWNIINNGKISISKNVELRETCLGWVFTGNIYCQGNNRNFIGCAKISDTQLHEQISKFWEIEDKVLSPLNSLYSPEELACEQYFRNTFRRNEDGRYIVKLPFKEDPAALGFSDQAALRRFQFLEKRLNKQPDVKQEYQKFMEEYLKLNHMALLAQPIDTDKNNQYCLPHHGVYKAESTTTKLRVVFDGSSKTTSGKSLNDILMIGPTIQEDLFSIITRFRTFQIALSCDIIKMYRQILLHPDDRKFQRIIWRSDQNEKANLYELNTVTYGLASSAYLATKCLQQLAQDNKEHYPSVSKIIERDFYVDDLLTGCNTEQEAIKIKNDLIAVLGSAGFKLQKWASNNHRVLHDEENFIKSTTQAKNKNETKTLGLTWKDAEGDFFEYNINIHNSQSTHTKRSVLSSIAQIYDLLGLLAPIVVQAKIFMQKLWSLKVHWDDILPVHLQGEWDKYVNNLKHLKSLKIPRKVVQESYEKIELHGFCDASMQAYGCCIYIRTYNSLKNIYHTQLLCARSRVAPLKVITLPRLELCAALLLTRLFVKLNESLNLKFDSTYFWTDSSIVLCWLQSPPKTWEVFVANRVSEIQSNTIINNWYHISTGDNPADIVSRGMYADLLAKSNLWFHGPKFLEKDASDWPDTKFQKPTPIEKKRVLAAVTTNSSANETLKLLSKFSSYNKLQRVVAYCLRFANNCSKHKNKLTGVLTIPELNKATKIVLTLTQNSTFSEEIKDLKRNKQVRLASKLSKLNPFLDENSLIRVGGRLRHATISNQQKFPIVLPSNHHVTKLIISKIHVEQLHAGLAATLSAVRNHFWPLSGRSTTRKLIHNCTSCFRANPRTEMQMMGDLPESRVTPGRPFLVCGIDYAGPVLVKEGTRRSKRVIKTYIALFKCFKTKAVHIELVNDCTAESFINALKRFMGRRGKVNKIYSDNATYFTAANRELQHLFKSSDFDNKIIQPLHQQNIDWEFIPANSPHRGGLWESGIKAIKSHLRRVTANALLTYEEFYTVLVQIESCINSRPLTPLSCDPNDPLPLTPAHFLIGGALTTNQETDLTGIKEGRLSRWQHVQQMVQHFWKRWSMEYLNTLQQRSKWTRGTTKELKKGTPVLLKDDNLHPLAWRMGIIWETHPGRDNIIRTVSVKTSTGIVTRAVNRICPFPDNS